MALPITRSHLERRLRKLEAHMTDGSHLVPHTKAWLLYWAEKLGKYLRREVPDMHPLIPLEAYRAVQEACDERQLDSPYAADIRMEWDETGDQDVDMSAT